MCHTLRLPIILQMKWPLFVALLDIIIFVKNTKNKSRFDSDLKNKTNIMYRLLIFISFFSGLSICVFACSLFLFGNAKLVFFVLF